MTYQALVYVNPTGGPGEAGVVTVACKHVDAVLTGTTILARAAFAFVDIHL